MATCRALSIFMENKGMDLAKDVARLGRIPLVVVLEFMALMAAGCAHEQRQKKDQARLVIPHECISAVRATEKTKCEPLPDKPNVAKCTEVLVPFNCTKVIQP